MAAYHAEARTDAGYYQQQVHAAQQAQQQQNVQVQAHAHAHAQAQAHAHAYATQQHQQPGGPAAAPTSAYPAHMQQAQQHGAMAGQPGQMADGAGGIVLIDAYGQQTGYWPPPQAPRISAAAARAASMNARAYWDTSLASYHAAPWGAHDAWGRAPYHSAQQQQQQQHQSMLHHQLAKLQGPYSSAPQDAGWQASQQRQAHAEQYHQQAQANAQAQARHAVSSGYAVPAHLSQAYDPVARQTSQPQAHAAVGQAYQPAWAPVQNRRYSQQPQQQQQQQQPLPISEAYFQQQQQHAVVADPHHGNPSWPTAGTQARWNAPVIAAPVFGEALPPQPPTWGLGGEYEAQRRKAAELAAANAAPAPPPSAEQAAAAAAPADGPLPPSPNTLDKSGLPLSGLGAEIIWGACAALLEPELISSRRSSASSRRTSSSIQSSPMVMTPVTSPPVHASKNGDWPAAGRQISNDGGSSLLHRLAVVGAGNGSSDPVDSSDSSSASASEPGTPPSMSGSEIIRSAAQSEIKLRADGSKLRGLGLGGVGATRAGSPMESSSPELSSGSDRRLTRAGSFSSKSMDRSRTSVSSILRLISPDWRWSSNDDTLPSLSAPASTETRPSAATRPRRRSSAHGSPHQPSMNGIAAPGSEISPAFRRFAHQVLAQTLLSPTAFLLALLYALRVPHLAVGADGELDAEAREIFASPPSAAPFKIFTLGLMIANKHLDDHTFTASTWHDVTGIPLLELNRMEAYFLARCGFEVTVPERVWIAFLKRLRSREENKAAAASAAAASAAARRSSVRSTASSTEKLAGAVTPDEASRRLLLAIDDALTALGQFSPLPSAVTTASSALSSPSAMSYETVDDEPRDVGRMRRPTSALQFSHHHCRSAPACGNTFATQPMVEDDVFDEEESPYRPQGGASHSSRPSLDASLARSNSDWSASLANLARAPHSFDPLASVRSSIDAPLAPSVLLALLNRM